MTTTIALYPTSEQIRTLLATPEDQPVVMVNLLRFKAAADSPVGSLEGQWLLAATTAL